MRTTFVRQTLFFACALAALPGTARAGETGADDTGERPFSIEGSYVADVDGVVDGPQRGARYVDLLRIDATADLERIAGWHGARAVFTFEAGTGAQPNALAGTVEGFDNAETSLDRPRLFQAYIQQDFGSAAQVKAGFVDLNADFYSTQSSGLLIAPPFGIGSELAASGPNGPSIFPSTAPTLALRLKPAADFYLGLAAISAEARVLGDPGGPAPLLRQGALLIGEAGWTGGGRRIALGAWRYTRRQDDLHDTDPAGTPLARRAWGVYGLVEQPLGGTATAFLRGGVSDGRTTTFGGSVQTGVLVGPVFAGRPSSRFSAGFHAGFLGGAYRASMADAQVPQRHAEYGWELTYEDQLSSWLTVQPDMQVVRDPAMVPGSRDAVIFALRLTLTPPGQD